MDDPLGPASAALSPPRFARGFVLSDIALEPPVREWVTQETAGLGISRAPDVPLTMARSGGRFVVVLGTFVDTATWSSMEAAVSSAVEAFTRSEDEFLDATDAWSGRYIVIFGAEANRHVMTDATGMRSAFYPLSGRFVMASHARLVARLTHADRSPLMNAYREIVQHAIVHPHRRSLVMSMPGRSTPWSGIVYLTANTALDIETRQLRRVFPRRRPQRSTPAGAAALIAPRLSGQVSSLVDSGRPVAISITAGLDSRVSLAASRQVRDVVRYFTYRRDDVPSDDEDVATASSMAEALHLGYGVIDVGASVDPPELDSAIREATFLSHGRRIVAAYRTVFSPDTIHVRSNIGEVGRCFYRRSLAAAEMATSPSDIPARDLARLWAHGGVSEPVVQAFAEWIQATGFRDVAGLDALDLFYWEHRMACWHSNVVLESDFAFDTHVLFNSRWVLERMLSVPEEDRLRGSVFRHLIAGLWPELAAWPTDHPRPSRLRGWRTRGWRSVLGAIRRRLG